MGWRWQLGKACGGLHRPDRLHPERRAWILLMEFLHVLAPSAYFLGGVCSHTLALLAPCSYSVSYVQYSHSHQPSLTISSAPIHILLLSSLPAPRALHPVPQHPLVLRQIGPYRNHLSGHQWRVPCCNVLLLSSGLGDIRLGERFQRCSACHHNRIQRISARRPQDGTRVRFPRLGRSVTSNHLVHDRAASTMLAGSGSSRL